MLSVRVVPVASALQRFTANSYMVDLTADASSWRQQVVAAELTGVLVVPPESIEPTTVATVAWYATGELSSTLVLDSAYLAGGGGSFSVKATDEMLQVLRGRNDFASQLMVHLPIAPPYHVQQLALRVTTDEPEWQAPPAPVALPMEPIVLRCRYQGERQSEPFVLFQETAVATLHALGIRRRALQTTFRMDQSTRQRMIAFLECIAVLHRERLERK